MLNIYIVGTAVRGIQALTRELVADLDVESGGFKGWKHTLADNDARELADYVVGASQAVGSNLQSVGVHLQDYDQQRAALDGKMRLQLSKTGNIYPDPRTDDFHEKELRLSAVERAFYVTVGSVLDALTALLIGTAGLSLNIHKADSRILLPLGPAEDYPRRSKHRDLFKSLANSDGALEEQLKVIRAFSGAFRAAGPDGWLEWVLGMRNMVVHREHRGSIVVVTDGPNHSKVISRLPAADPSLSSLQGFAAAGDRLSGYFLPEDLGAVLRGITKSVDASCAAVVSILRDLWKERRLQPGLITQPAAQWGQKRDPISFAGYNPRVDLVTKSTTLAMNPDDWTRLMAGGLGHPRKS